MDVWACATDRLKPNVDILLVLKRFVHHLLFYFLKFVSQRVKNLLRSVVGAGDVYVGHGKRKGWAKSREKPAEKRDRQTKKEKRWMRRRRAD